MLVALLLFQSAAAPTPMARHDMLHYDVSIAFGDSGTTIRAEVGVRWVIGSAAPLRLDLDPALTVVTVTTDGRPVRWSRDGAAVVVPTAARIGDTVVTRVAYEGPVSDGLVLRGSGPTRTVFADNWPDRARKWLASVDHPSDKATVDWHVDAPLGLTVVATGTLERVDTLGATAVWHLRMPDPTPVHTMVIGAARLATTTLAPAQCHLRCVPVRVLTYPADSAFAVEGPFRRAGEMIDVMARLFGPFPYPELRHVQSSTIFGGMENSTAIFYDERGYAQRTMGESVVAHETAHQWFGDAVSQTSWSHLWLSEGFATYGAALWAEHVNGATGLREAMTQARARVLRAEVRHRPIVDSTASLMALLNANNYQKGAWVLHSLRGLVGDSAFFRGLRTYVQIHWHGNALSDDFARVMTSVAGTDLSWYFRQALGQPGYPVFSVSKARTGRTLTVTLRQVQEPAWGTFRLPNLAVRVHGTVHRVNMTSREVKLVVPGAPADAEVVVDPDGWWLHEVRGER